MRVVVEDEGVYGVSTYDIDDKALSVNIERVWSCLLASGAMVMVVSSARFIVCLSGCDLISICVVV